MSETSGTKSARTGNNEDIGEQRAASSSALSSTNGPVSKETPILISPSITYGLQETHTTIIPVYNCFGVYIPPGVSQQWQPAEFNFRLNSLWDIFQTAQQDNSGGGDYTAHTIVNQFLVRKNNNGTWAKGTASDWYTPPMQNSTAEVNEGGNWREYFAKIYQYYTVIGTEYEITIRNAKGGHGNELMVAMAYETFNGNGVGDRMPGKPFYKELLGWKAIVTGKQIGRAHV